MICKKIENIEELKKLSGAYGGLDCFISFGCLRSSKHITYDAIYGFDVIHEVDDSSDECLSDEDLYKKTNIGEALDKGALFAYGSEEESDG